MHTAEQDIPPTRIERESTTFARFVRRAVGLSTSAARVGGRALPRGTSPTLALARLLMQPQVGRFSWVPRWVPERSVQGSASKATKDSGAYHRLLAEMCTHVWLSAPISSSHPPMEVPLFHTTDVLHALVAPHYTSRIHSTIPFLTDPSRILRFAPLNRQLTDTACFSAG